LFNPRNTETARPQLSTGRLMLLVAIVATCLALYATSNSFAAVTGAASPSAGLTAVLAWTLAAALPALWVATLRRAPPDGLLARIAIGNGFIAILLGFMSAFLIVLLIAVAAAIPSIGWYGMSQMTAGDDRERLRSYIIAFLHYVMQLILTLLLFIATIPLLAAILR
jgi:hypothetical protein